MTVLESWTFFGNPASAVIIVTLAVLLLIGLAGALLCVHKLRQMQSVLRDRRRQLEELYLTTCRTLVVPGGDPGEEEFLHTGLEAICRLIGARYGAIGILDDDDSHRHFLTYGVSAEERARIGHPPRGVGLLGNLAEIEAVSGSLLLDDLASDPRSVGFPENHPAMKTLLVVPVSTRKKIYGRLYLSEREDDSRPFSGEDAGLARGLAQTMGLALESSREMAERKRVEEERQELEARIRHAQKLESLRVLAGGIAHDFNNLLMAVLGNAEMATGDLSLSSPVRGNIEQIEAAARQAAELSQQMLAYSGRWGMVAQENDLNKILTDMGHLLESSVSKKVEVCFELEQKPCRMKADAAQIRQLVMSLVSNASEAMETEGGVVTLRTGHREVDRQYLDSTYADDRLPEGCYAFLDVSDTGPGMDEETLAKVFDPFFTTRFVGRGLGLAAALGIVRGHRGAVKISSRPGEGTTVRVVFPDSRYQDSEAACGACEALCRGV